MAMAPMNAHNLPEAVRKLESIGYKRCETSHVAKGMCWKKEGVDLHVTLIRGERQRIYICEVD